MFASSCKHGINGNNMSLRLVGNVGGVTEEVLRRATA